MTAMCGPVGSGPATDGKTDGAFSLIDLRAYVNSLLAAAGLLASFEVGPGSTLSLPPLADGEVTALADLIQVGLAQQFEVAQELMSAFRFHGVCVLIDVVDGRFSLGAVSAANADRIAVALGAPRIGDGREVDYGDWATARLVSKRVADRMQVIGGLAGHITGCRRDGSNMPTVFLGEVGVDVARKLALALNRGTGR